MKQGTKQGMTRQELSRAIMNTAQEHLLTAERLQQAAQLLYSEPDQLDQPPIATPAKRIGRPVGSKNKKKASKKNSKPKSRSKTT